MLEPEILIDLLADQTRKATMKLEAAVCGSTGVAMALRGRVIEIIRDQVQATLDCDKQVELYRLADHVRKHSQ